MKRNSRMSFVCMPKIFFDGDSKYSQISNDAKLLAGLLRDRKSLSMRNSNNWQDAQGVYIYYTIESISNDLHCCRGKACKLLAELEIIGYIKRVRQGQGHPDKIYVLDDVLALEYQNPDSWSDNIQSSRCVQSNLPDDQNIVPNSTNQKYPEYIYTDISSITRLADIKTQIEYDLLCEIYHDKTTLLGTIVGVIADAEKSRKKTLRVGGNDLLRDEVVAVLRSLNRMHIEYIIDCLAASHPNIHNIRAYLLTALYYAPSTMDAYYDAQVARDYPSL